MEKLFTMKKITATILVISLLTIGLVGLVLAQKRGGEGFGGHGFPPPFLIEKIATELGLSDEQKEKAKQVLEDSKARIQPLMEAMRAGHIQAKDLGKDGVFDENAVVALATRQSETMKQIIIEKEKTKAALFAILTPEQRTKAEQLRETFESKRKERFGQEGKGFGKRGKHGEGFPPIL